MTEPVAWPLGLGLLGAILGSFIATLVVRWPQGRSVLRGRSACDGCGRTLAAIDLVPIAGFVAARGRCRWCGGRIDPRHLVIELVAAVVGMLAGWATSSPAALAGAAFGWLLLTLAALDLAIWWLPDRLTALLAASGLAMGLAGVEPRPVDRLIGGIVGWAALALIGWGYRRLRGRRGLGGGDPKLLGAIGLWLGWRLLPAVLLVACLVGLGVVAWRLATGRRVAGGDAMPLGTLLAIAAYPAWLIVIASPS